LPFPPESKILIQQTCLQSCAEQLNQELRAMDLRWQWRPALASGVGFAQGNVWSRAARRKHLQQDSQSTKIADGIHDMDVSEVESAFVFKIQLQENTERGVEVNVRWLQGKDIVLIESFSGMLKRKLQPEI